MPPECLYICLDNDADLVVRAWRWVHAFLGTYSYTFTKNGEETDIHMNDNPDIEWEDALFGLKADVFDKHGFEYTVYTDPRDAFALDPDNF